MDLGQKAKVFKLLTKMLNLHVTQIESCNDKKDFYALFIATLMFKKLTESQFKEDYKKYETGSYEKIFDSLDEMATDLVKSFLEECSKNLN